RRSQDRAVPLALFSGRRRHTTFSRDWSSDVCSSDLQVCDGNSPLRAHGYATPKSAAKISEAMATSQNQVVGSGAGRLRVSNNHEIGRASCRERVKIRSVTIIVKKQITSINTRRDRTR